MTAFWKRRVCLVTGGAGFGGSHLCSELLRRGARVYAYDLLLPGDSSPCLEGWKERVEWVTGDVLDRDFLAWVASRFEVDTIFHLAAQPLVPLAREQPWHTLQVNALGTYAVLEVVRTVPVVEGLVVASSGAYYGTTRIDRAIRESDAPAEIENIYAASKMAADAAVRAYSKSFGIKAAVCRFMNTYGPGDTNFSRIVPKAIRNLMTKSDYDFGDRDDGTTLLDVLHIRDMSAAYLRVAERLDQVSGEAFNIGSGRAVALRELVELTSELFDGRGRCPRFAGAPQPRPKIKTLDVSKARELLGWKPSIELREGLGSTIEWYRKHWSRLGQPG